VNQKLEYFIKEISSDGTPTTKAVGSELVTKYQPTALVVGGAKNGDCSIVPIVVNKN
jgi:hypothetical protein